ncbi:type VI secretion system-associated protein TagF, partial [candidate division KSB1 bacterium]|nr:type VI secretion system-associated protein TagF [candidate division KSB1 bacterium]
GSSEDQSGRKYPFTVFSIVVQKKYGATLAAIPLAFNEFFVKAHTLINGGWAAMDAKRLTNWAEGSTVIPMFQDFKSSMQTMTLESYFKAVTETYESDRKYLIFNNLMVLLGQLRNQNTQRFSLGLQLPLSRQSRQWSFESAVWLEIIFGYLGRAHSEPVFFWNLDSREDQPYLFLFLRPPPPKFLIHLIRPDLDSELVCNLATEGISRITEIKQKMDVTLKNWLDSPSMALTEFIGKFSMI